MVPSIVPDASIQATVELSYEIIGYILSNGTNQVDKYKCHMPSCSEATFGRLADLKRHRASRHGAMRKSYWCPVSGCERSLNGGGRPFPRKDKMFQYLSQKHADITSSGSD